MRAIKVQSVAYGEYKPWTVWYGEMPECACLYVSMGNETCTAFSLDGEWRECNEPLRVESRVYVMDDGTLKVEHA